MPQLGIHCSFGEENIKHLPFLTDVQNVIRYHHERLDGTGYLFHKTAAELNTQERMMACIDIYQALTETRPYKAGMHHKKAIAILQENAASKSM